MAEGAGALVLESLAHARARGAEVLGVVEGCGEVADGFHRTRSSPDGKPIIACMRKALADAGLAPDAIGYVNAHGTGTPENDKMEWVGLVGGVRRAGGVDPDLVEQVDDRPHADRGRDGGGDLHCADDAAWAAAADDQLRHSRSGAAGGLRAERCARGAGGACDFEFVRVWRAECLPGARARRPAQEGLGVARLVIGGRRGIGAAVVRTPCARGMAVTYTYRTEPATSPHRRCGAFRWTSPIVTRWTLSPRPGEVGRPGTRWCRWAAPPTTRWRQ